jgi:hypothetical protein
MPSINDPEIQRLEPCSITYQLAAYGLLPEREGEVIDLSNSGPDDQRPPPRQKRRRVRWPRGAVVLRAVASEDGRALLAWCVYCHREHIHGRHGADSDCGPGCGCQLHGGGRCGRGPCTCPVGAGDGPRGAHCSSNSGSPLAESGYWVQEADR